MYTIGKLSKNTGVTVRTLDYYDEIGLLNPSSKTEGGHRLYSEDDVMQLERVLALKYMGFSLDKIKEILGTKALNWQESIQQQLDMVKREQERLKMLEQALLGVSYSIEFEEEVNWPIIYRVIQFYHQDPEEVFQEYNHHLNMEEIQKLADINAKMTEEDIHKWMEAIYDIKRHIHIDPRSEQALELAQRWLNQAEKMFEGDEEFMEDLWEPLQDLQEGIAFYPMDKEVVGFLQRVSEAHKEAK
ncbi:MerR family transcriptional regulator [Paucisalibacillus sp. EB02]|uniref:MerR family transcriptional regulator n=1 Tax=Paucisalibacillus sp. EB02 TaxID=1347087 RepID=UPI0004B7714E|nr:MerR family transcriptional regulator [Paucisalibacillus sp. EB02]